MRRIECLKMLGLFQLKTYVNSLLNRKSVEGAFI